MDDAREEVRCLTAREVAAVLSCSQGTAYRLIREGQLPSIRIGSAGRRVTTKALQKFIESGGAAA